jgi:predicted DNA-binding transcriptional regulator YafY
MRADRLLSILLLLQVHRRMTARALAERLEVTPRTIHRDMEALSAAGIPVHAERGSGGGWVLPEAFRTDLTGLTPAESQALFLATPPRLLADLGLAKASDAALVKLLAALPAVARRGAEYVRQRILLDAPGWRPGAEATLCLPALQDALWRERKVRLVYGRPESEPTARLVDPLGLVAKCSTWYLVAGVDGDLRTYRVSRVQAVEPTDEPATRPPDFDLAAYWARSAAAFVAALPSYPLTVRVAPEALSRLTFPGAYARVEHVGEPEADGWRTVRLQHETADEAASYVLGFGPRMTVLAPAALRERVVELAYQTVAHYAHAAPAPAAALPAPGPECP